MLHNGNTPTERTDSDIDFSHFVMPVNVIIHRDVFVVEIITKSQPYSSNVHKNRTGNQRFPVLFSYKRRGACYMIENTGMEDKDSLYVNPAFK